MLWFHPSPEDKNIVESYILSEDEIADQRIAEIQRMNEENDRINAEIDASNQRWWFRLVRVEH